MHKFRYTTVDVSSEEPDQSQAGQRFGGERGADKRFRTSPGRDRGEGEKPEMTEIAAPSPSRGIWRLPELCQNGILAGKGFRVYLCLSVARTG